ncbi:unnamed protein product [Staurois parvus]|uniref:Uncharacterized protein n=1 Tax=Staurois parvus TaxID=386267 RepID=A0ABN9F0F7_9NEOB|nr:unnamed protein product [Staurois parvus]
MCILNAVTFCIHMLQPGIRGVQGRTDNSWGPRAIGDHRAPVSLPKLKKSL